MKPNLVMMTSEIAHELVKAFSEGYFDESELCHTKDTLIEAFYVSAYEIIIDWLKLCSKSDYENMVANPNIYKNIYDEAFDRGVKAAIQIIFWN